MGDLSSSVWKCTASASHSGQSLYFGALECFGKARHRPVPRGDFNISNFSLQAARLPQGNAECTGFTSSTQNYSISIQKVRRIISQSIHFITQTPSESAVTVWKQATPLLVIG